MVPHVHEIVFYMPTVNSILGWQLRTWYNNLPLKQFDLIMFRCELNQPVLVSGETDPSSSSSLDWLWVSNSLIVSANLWIANSREGDSCSPWPVVLLSTPLSEKQEHFFLSWWHSFEVHILLLIKTLQHI